MYIYIHIYLLWRSFSRTNCRRALLSSRSECISSCKCTMRSRCTFTSAVANASLSASSPLASVHAGKCATCGVMCACLAASSNVWFAAARVCTESLAVLRRALPASTRPWQKILKSQPRIHLQWSIWSRADFCAILGVTGWRRPIGCLSRSFFKKEPLIPGLFCRKWHIKIRHPMGLRLVTSWLLRNYRCWETTYGVATISRLLKITGLFCRI